LIPHDIAIDSSGNIYVSDSGNVHFLAGDTCRSFEGKNWTSSIRKIYDSTLSGDKQVPPVETDVIGQISITVPRSESEIEYKINIIGASNITSAYMHMGKHGENGETVADLLKDSKKNKMENQTGVVIRGGVINSDLIGPMNGKSLHDLINAITDGQTYVNVTTASHPKGEIRGQIEVAAKSLGE
jgi:hypothetical protein